MNDTGKNIVSGFRELRGFCREVSLLLRTASEDMEDKDWETTAPAYVFEANRAILLPDWWLPHEFCRFFKNATSTRLLTFIAVNLDNPEDYDCPLDEALISAGCIVFFAGRKRAKVKHWMARWHLFMDAQKDDGSLCLDEPQANWKPENGDEEPPAGVQKVITFAYPLVDVADGGALRTKIVEPLLKVIKEEQATLSKAK